jgi:hypothetical protein
MSFWLGCDENYHTDGIPHLTKIARKPRGVGAEIKTVVDGQTNKMLRVEVLEGAERQETKEFHYECSAGTEVTLRLAKPWAGTGRTIVGDSAFASVKTAIELGIVFYWDCKKRS